MRIMIAVPCGTLLHSEFAKSLYNLDTKISGVTAVDLRMHKSSCLVHSRFRLVDAARHLEYDKILFLDSDMMFPPETLRSLLSHNLPIVGVNYLTRANFIEPTAKYKGLTRLSIHESAPLTKVEGLGFGVVLMDTSVFDKLSQPWFEFPWDDAGGYYHSEDYVLCSKLIAAGYDIYVDNDLSKKVGHIGEIAFTHKSIQQR